MGWDSFDSWEEVSQGDRIQTSMGLVFLVMESPDPQKPEQRPRGFLRHLRDWIRLEVVKLNPPDELPLRKLVLMEPRYYKVFR